MEWLLTLSTAVALLILFAVLELAGHRGVAPQTTRQIAHVVGAATAATFPLYLQLRDVLLLAFAFTVFLAYTWIHGNLRSVHAVGRPSIGAVLFPIGLGIAALAAWRHPRAFEFGALVLALADPAAATAGNRIAMTRWRVSGGEKSVSGSVTFFLVSVTLGIIFGLASGEPRLLPALAVAAILTMVEGSLGYGLDNLLLPLSAAILGQTLLGL